MAANKPPSHLSLLVPLCSDAVPPRASSHRAESGRRTPGLDRQKPQGAFTRLLFIQ